MDTKTKTAVIVAVIIVVLVGVYAAQALDDKHEDYRDSTETYYFYLDGMDSHIGWYTADGQNAQEALTAADTGLTITFSDSGWITVDGYEGTYNQSTGTGTGISVYTYTSTDVANPDGRYFVTGPVLKDVLGNIIYITYSSYSFDANYNTVNAVSPTTGDAWKTGGPFASGSDYKAPSYDTYYFYLGGVGTASGWYSASGDSVGDAFLKATASSGLTITLSDRGWLNVAEYPGTYNSSTNTGEGFGVFAYLSSDSVPSTYYVADSNHVSTIPNASSNILLVYYSAYGFDSSWNTTYTVSPTTDSTWTAGGPFAA